MTKYLTPTKAIKLYCKLDCCAGDTKSWKECSRKDCPLYAYRLGKRPQKVIATLTNYSKKTYSNPVIPTKIEDKQEQLK